MYKSACGVLCVIERGFKRKTRIKTDLIALDNYD
jgi:hypothetical protein